MIQKKLWMLFAAALMVAAPLAFVACGEDEATACSTTADCDSGEACVSGVCKPTCEVADDCVTGQCAVNCDDSDANFCFDPCTSDDDCSVEGQTCQEFCGGRHKECRTSGLETCEEDADCSLEGQICSDDSKTCIQGCREDADCADDEYCDQDALGCAIGCRDDDGCEGDEVCVDHVCAEPDNTCEDNATCYDQGEFYCAADSDGDTFCAGISCGVEWNNCDACTNGPNNGARDENGPMIFNAGGPECAQTANCANDAPWECRFSFSAFDPNNKLPTSSLKDHIVKVAGSVISENWAMKNDAPGEYSFTAGCFGTEAAGKNAKATVYLRNTDNKVSNSLCFGD